MNRYIGEVGDLVVGRVKMVESKRWKVDIEGQKVTKTLPINSFLPFLSSNIVVCNSHVVIRKFARRRAADENV